MRRMYGRRLGTGALSVAPFMVIMLCVSLFAAEVPDNYNGLAFGSGVEQLKAAYPVSESYKCSLSVSTKESSGDIDVYVLFYRKGQVEKVNFYYLKNRLAMVAEQSYPGAEISAQIYKKMTARYGQFVGRGSASWKRRADYLIMINHHEDSQVTTVSYLFSPLADSLRERTNYIKSNEERDIDRQIREVRSAIDSLVSPADTASQEKKR